MKNSVNNYPHNNLSTELLKLKGFKNPAEILLVCNTCEQPVTALELILGIYIEPVINPHSMVRKRVCTLISYNPLASREITYKYTKICTDAYYYNQEYFESKEQALEALQSGDYNKECITKGYSGKCPDHLADIPTGKTTEREDACTLSAWEEGYNAYDEYNTVTCEMSY